MKAVSLYVTCESHQQAENIARSLLEEKLVACVNIMPSMQSLYWWNDEIQKDSETAFFAKTTPENVNKATQKICELHTYDVPCVVALPIENGNLEYLDWIAKETQNDA